MLTLPPAGAYDDKFRYNWKLAANDGETESLDFMSTLNRITVGDVGKILDESNIQEMGRELFTLVGDDNTKLLLNFNNVEFLSSAALGKLITLNKKVKANSGQLKLSNIRPEIYEVFAITRLNKLFEIHDDEADALATF